jgi:hypothetical protein
LNDSMPPTPALGRLVQRRPSCGCGEQLGGLRANPPQIFVSVVAVLCRKHDFALGVSCSRRRISARAANLDHHLNAARQKSPTSTPSLPTHTGGHPRHHFLSSPVIDAVCGMHGSTAAASRRAHAGMSP